METRKFVVEKIVKNDILEADGVVIDPNGELRQPDHCEKKPYDQQSMKGEWIKTWDEIGEDEFAGTWEWHDGCYRFKVQILPEVITQQMIATAKRLYREILQFHVTEINWHDRDLWQRNPTGAPGWNLEPAIEPTAENFCAQLLATDQHIQSLSYHPFDVIPYTALVRCGTEWRVDVGICSRNEPPRSFSLPAGSELLSSPWVKAFMQWERDCICHSLVIDHLKSQRDHYAPLYEQYRARIEFHGGELIDLGYDGFCLIVNAVPELYTFKAEDFELFQAYGEGLVEPPNAETITAAANATGEVASTAS